jgi:hypothetical protein
VVCASIFCLSQRESGPIPVSFKISSAKIVFQKAQKASSIVDGFIVFNGCGGSGDVEQVIKEAQISLDFELIEPPGK